MTVSAIAEQLPTKEEFSEHIDSIFEMRLDDDQPCEITLVGVTEVISNAVQENFTVLFRAPVDAPPKQGIYRLDHKHLAPVELFLVPVKKDESGLYFEAVFNHLVAAE